MDEQKDDGSDENRFFRISEAFVLSFRPASRETRRVTEEARERVKQRMTSRGWRKILTAAMETAPKVPTMIKSAEARRIMKRPSSAAGNAIFKYFLS